jgi:acyl-CoA thioesterase
MTLLGSIPATRFDTDTAVTRVASGLYGGRIDRGWWIVNGPNGGYVAAILLRALAAEVNDSERAPRSLTVHYLRPPAEGPVDVAVVIERSGRSLTTATARLLQGDRLLALAIGAFASARTGFSFDDRVMPVLPPLETCERFRDKYPNAVELQRRYDTRIGIGEPFGSGSGRAIVGGWIGFDEPRATDALAVAAYTDAFVPAIFTRVSAQKSVGPVPTVDLTIHFRAPLPLPSATLGEHCAAIFSSSTARDGFVEEDGEIWSRDGVLLAQSRQLAILG